MTTNNDSIFQRISRMPDEVKRQQLLEHWGRFNPTLYWEFTRRTDQIPPVDNYWNMWIYSGGRGAGKTRLGVEETCAFAEKNPESRLLIIAPTKSDIRNTIIEGESGIMARYERAQRPTLAPEWSPAIRRLTWSNKSIAFLVAADDLIEASHDGERYSPLRGVQSHFTWIDELASWPVPEGYGESTEALTILDEARIATRLGIQPRILVTTTPHKTPATALLQKYLEEDPIAVRLTEAGLGLNAANLAPNFNFFITEKYGGTEMAKGIIEGLWPWNRT